MRPHLREFFELCAKTLACPEPIVEIGAFQVAGQEKISDLRPLFPGKTYVGCDMQTGPGVDRLEDIHNLSCRSGQVGTFLLADTLEHVADPCRAMHEIYRCLRDDGLAQAERSDDLGQGRPSPCGPSYKHCHGRYT